MPKIKGVADQPYRYRCSVRQTECVHQRRSGPLVSSPLFLPSEEQPTNLDMEQCRL